jgi:SAM-dependent methyltransferase
VAGTCHDGGVGGPLRYRKGLYEGTAAYYDRFRPRYPDVLLDDLRARVHLDGTGRLLDLACGTGQLAFALEGDVAEVWAVDQEAGSIEFARRKALRLEATHIRWIAAAAEDVALEGAFDLVTVGNAFHRLDRGVVARRLVPHLRDGGCMALVWGGAPWRGTRAWQGVLHAILERWRDAMGARDRVPQGWEQVMDRDPHEDVLRRAGLAYEGRFEFTIVQRWTLESLIGFVYSTSDLNRAVLGRHSDGFESDLRRHLLACRPDGAFDQDLTFAYQLARRASAR